MTTLSFQPVFPSPRASPRSRESLRRDASLKAAPTRAARRSVNIPEMTRVAN